MVERGGGMRWFRKRRKPAAGGAGSIRKDDFSDCVTADYLPGYSVCRSENSAACRHKVHFAGMILCGHPDRKRFIPADAEPFDPHEGQF